MRIALISSPQSWYARDLARAAVGRCDIVPVTFAELLSVVHPDTIDVRSCQADADRTELSLTTDVDACLIRSMPPGTLEQVVFRMNALGELERSGVPVVNPAAVLETAIDKYRTLARIRETGLRVPPTIVCQTSQQALAAFTQLGGDVVIKPLFGSEGRGLIRVEQGELARRAIHTLTRLGAVVYLQRFIPHEGCDLRLLVIGNEVLGMRRINRSDWRTNVGQGATTEVLRVTDQLREIALRSARAISATLAAVDVLPGCDGELYVLEVNGVPGWKALARTLHVDVAERVLDHLIDEGCGR